MSGDKPALSRRHLSRYFTQYFLGAFRPLLLSRCLGSGLRSGALDSPGRNMLGKCPCH